MKYKLPNILLATYVVLVTIALMYHANALTVTAIVPELGIKEVNQYRKEHHLKAITYASWLCPLSYVRVKESETEFNHYKFAGHLDDAPAGFYSENLARTFPTAQDAINAWKVSKTHNAILLGKMEQVCITRDGNYWQLTGYRPYGNK